MRKKELLLSLLLVFASCFSINVLGLTNGAQIQFDKEVYLGYGVQPMIKLTDASLNVRTDRQEELIVALKSTSDPDGIFVTLVEDSADSGVFTGSFNFDPSKSDDIKRKLQISYNDTITATYNDAADSLSLSCSSTWRNSTGVLEFSKSTYTGIFSSAAVTLKDQDLNLSPSIRDAASVIITSDKDSKGIVLKLDEIGFNSGIFSGSFKFSTAASNSVIGTIKVGASSNLTAEYTDLTNLENSLNTIVSAKAAFMFTEAVIETTAVNDYGTGNMVDIIIHEPDNNNPDRIDTITAKVGAGSSSDDLTVRLEETGINTGEFRRTVHFTDRKSNRNLLYMLGMDKVNIKYVDHTIPQGGSTEIIKSIGWEYQSTVITLDRESYAGYNTSAEITLYNMELNNYADRKESIYVDVETNNSKELYLELTETGKSTGIFRGKINFGRSSDKKNNTLKMKGEDSILVSYVNRRDKSDIAQCFAEWSPHDGKLILNRQTYSGTAAVVEVTLEDWDVAENSAVRDEVKVIARVPGTSKKRTLTLTETKRDSGIFTETFYINGGDGKFPSIEMQQGDVLEVAYTDEDTTSGLEETRTASAVWTGISDVELTLDQSSYKGYGTYMIINLTDPDYNKRINAIESVEVIIKTSANAKGARYVLKETDSDSGVFTASLKLSADPPSYSNIMVGNTDRIIVTFVDKNVSAAADFSK